LKLLSIYGISFAEYHIIFTNKIFALYEEHRAIAIGPKEHSRRMKMVNFNGQ